MGLDTATGVSRNNERYNDGQGNSYKGIFDARKESFNAAIKLFDKQTGELLNEFAGHVNKNYRVEAVLNHTDHFVLSGSENGFVYVWDMVDGKLVKKLDHALDGAISSGITIHSLAFHPKSAELLTAVRGKVYIWRNAAS